MSATVDVLEIFTLAELREHLAEAQAELTALTADGKRRFPRGFTGDDVVGDYEAWEAEWADAERAVRECRAALARVGGAA